MTTGDDALDADMQRITDCFSGADGGIGYFKTMRFLEHVEARCKEGDREAGQIIEIVRRFSRLVKYAGEQP